MTTQLWSEGPSDDIVTGHGKRGEGEATGPGGDDEANEEGTAEAREEAVWALVVICADDEANLKWCSRLCADPLRRVRSDVAASPRASAMAAFLCEKIKEWRTGGNR